MFTGSLSAQDETHWVKIKTAGTPDSGSLGQPVKVYLLDQNGHLFLSEGQPLVTAGLTRVNLSGPFLYSGSDLRPGNVALHNTADNPVRITRMTTSLKPNKHYTDFFHHVNEQNTPNRCNETLWGKMTMRPGQIKRFIAKKPTHHCGFHVYKVKRLASSPADDIAIDSDGDGIEDSVDNCPNIANLDQSDLDGDGEGDLCDDTPYGEDSDGDGVYDYQDNCVSYFNPLQTDSNGDGLGDACSSRTIQFTNDDHDNYQFATYDDAAVVIDGFGEEVALESFELLTEPQRGSLALSGNELVYTPDGGFEGLDQFSYSLRNNENQVDEAHILVNLIQGDCNTANFSGTADGLVTLIPNHVISQDLIGNVTVYDQLDAARDTPTRAHMEQKTMVLQLEDLVLGNDALTLSFLTKPNTLGEVQVLLESNGLRIYQEEDRLFFEFINDGTVTTQIASARLLNQFSCNHVAVLLGGNTVSTLVNGERQDTALESAPDDLMETLRFPRHEGALWNVRIYDRLLGDEELAVLGENCTPDSAAAERYPDYPNFMCGIYVCEYWDSEIVAGHEESLDYYVHKQDEVYEENVFDHGMSPRGNLCDYIDNGSGKDLVLSQGIFNTFVRPYSFSSPLTQVNGQFWLHENFHSFQGKLKNYNGFGGNKYFLEASASWQPFRNIPAVRDTLIAFYTAIPHLPMWVVNGSPTEDRAGHDKQGGHAYGASIWWFYLTETVAYPRLIGDMFNDRRVASEPMAVAKDLVEAEGYDFAEIFADFAAVATTWDMEHEALWRESEEASLRRMAGGGDIDAVNHKFTANMDNSATCGEWTDVPTAYLPGSWANNAYEVAPPTVNETYRVAVFAESATLDPNLFRGRLVVYNSTTGERRYTPIAVSDDLDNAVEVDVDVAAGETLYLVVATTPDVFSGWDFYNYSYRIEALGQSCNEN
ncbi:thrombospondin type 3 repeat-containing protein [Sulfidibacter corallicola]|uniref:Thrombospondin type 3 repeat-containing protein n=1 Tax=Sulfidibacter corallicola TaxID=2818388 RepID=A0A8A4TML6_SULCO|nr:thrombospondin type 3 repeat-containing protein [Sulfidibacter corallicola]QTD50148.1 thrombospondin type 3 repeat-containing protein [Sulfidibacter corallicola]